MDKNYVSQFDFFKNIGPEDLEPILQDSLLETFPPEKLIIEQGKVQNSFFFILEGLVEIFLEENEHTHLANLTQGDYFGEMSVMTGEPASASVMAVEKTTILKVSRQVFLQLTKVCPELNTKLIQALLVRLKQTNQGVSEAFRKELTLCNYVTQEKKFNYGEFIAVSPSMQTVQAAISELATADSPLLMMGEPGTGKELAAAAIHYQSKRANRPFVTVNCFQLTPKNWEITLLGSKKDHGQLALAEGGSILFKNIEAIPSPCLTLLAQLLTGTAWKNRIRVFATSRKTPEELQSLLSPGIWSQLANPLIIPPLRNRREDTSALAHYFMIKYSREKCRNISRISHDAMRMLNSYSYLNANVKELEELIARAVLLTKGDCLEPEDLQFGISGSLRIGRPKIGLALGGGGAKGLAHVGVLEVLEQEQIEFDLIAGTSVGAIVGALYADGLPTSEIKNVIGKISWKQFVNLTLPRVGIFRSDGISEFINKLLGQKTFSQLNKPFAVVATDAATGQEVIIREGLLTPAIRGSATLPGLFQPICIDGKYLLDGGLVNNVPANVVRAMGADFVIAIDLGGLSEQVPRTMLQFLMQSIAIMANHNEASVAEWADVIIRPDLSKYSLTDLKLGQEIMEKGREAALRALPELTEKLKALQRLAI
jgi:NTE family protein